MQIEHIAVGYNSEEEADKFFIELLGMKKLRTKTVSAELMEAFFGVKRDNIFIQYGNEGLTFEVFITKDKSKAKDIFTHSCILINNRDGLVDKATSMGFEVTKVPRQDGNGYYLFIRDSFHNLYEVKENW
ncbi:MAG: VOC family protein [Promethearchaeota archaeon]